MKNNEPNINNLTHEGYLHLSAAGTKPNFKLVFTFCYFLLFKMTSNKHPYSPCAAMECGNAAVASSFMKQCCNSLGRKSSLWATKISVELFSFLIHLCGKTLLRSCEIIVSSNLKIALGFP